MKLLSLFLLSFLAANALQVGDVKVSRATAVSPKPAFGDRFIAMAPGTLWGFDANGNPVTITLGAGLSLSVGNELSASGGGSGDVTLAGNNIFTGTNTFKKIIGAADTRLDMEIGRWSHIIGEDPAIAYIDLANNTIFGNWTFPAIIASAQLNLGTASSAGRINLYRHVGTGSDGSITFQSLVGGSVTLNANGVADARYINFPDADGALLVTSDLGRLQSYLVEELPDAAESEGVLAYVTDANATTRLSTVAGGGSNKVVVFSVGTNWLIL